MSVKTLSMAVVLFCMVLLGTYGLGESFLVSEGSCNHDNDCGQGLCDRDNHCRCHVGWTGLRCSISDTHANFAGLCDHFLCYHGRCHQGSKCVCDNGWHGYVCDIPDHGHFETLPEATTASHLSGTPCGNRHCYQGYCENANHSRCQCDRGWAGMECTHNISGGSCNHDNDCGLGLCDRDNHCRCYVGWTGLRCSKSDTHANFAGLCDRFLCNHGRCHQGSKCVCDNGWHGYVCDIPDHRHFETLPEATTSSHLSGTPCGNHHCYQGYCENANHSRCQCDKGWAGMECTHNIAHCGGSQCYHGDCHFSNCECHPGWTGSECETALHVYECNGQPCHNGDCEWAPYRQQICKCFDGWTGQDCAKKGKVAWQQCGNDWCLRGECKIPLYYRNYHCICHRGWTGNRCNEPATLSHCNGINCYHGVCHSDVHNSESYCVCDVGWTQRDCNTQEVSTFTQPPTVQTQAPTSAPTTTTLTSTSGRTSNTTTHSPSTTLSTTNLPITPSTTTTQGTTVSPLHAVLCMKVATVSDIGFAKVSSNQNAISCASGNKTSPEAFVLEHCNVTAPSSWKEGVNIMANCDSLPLYTPVASFSSHDYSSAGTLCGVLIGCLQDGFQMAVQYCDQPPMIEHVVTNNGSFALDAATYYTIMI